MRKAIQLLGKGPLDAYVQYTSIARSAWKGVSRPLSAGASPAAPPPPGGAAPTSEAKPADAARASTSSEAATSTAALDAEKEQVQHLENARKAFMFPWERYQLENQDKPLRWWEKAYWGVFVVLVAAFLFNRSQQWMEEKKGAYKDLRIRIPVRPGSDAPPWPVDPEKEAREKERRRHHAVLVLGGRPFLEEEEDPLEGMTPQQVQDFIEQEVLGLPEGARETAQGIAAGALGGYRCGAQGSIGWSRL